MTGAAAITAASTLLRECGGRTVLLRMPLPAVQGDAGEQVGLAVPEFQDTALGPVVFRKVRPLIATDSVTYEVLVSAEAVLAVVGSLEYGSAEVLFAQALGLVVDRALLQVSAVTTSELFGVVYLYRVKCFGAEAVRA